jgi:molybdopterin-guanine dinucleotide biosynthesis protein A
MLSVVIQAGGQSIRMGQDKALMPFLGRPLIERILGRVSSLADELLITTNLQDGYRYLEIPLVPDIIPGRGILGGLYTALNAAHHPLVAVVACDLPFVSPEILTASLQTLEESDFDAVIPHSGKGLEPVHAIYRRETCLPAVEAAILANQWRMIAWHKHVNIRYLTEDEWQQFDPRGLAFWNVNTPEEFQHAEHLARQSE